MENYMNLLLDLDDEYKKVKLNNYFHNNYFHYLDIKINNFYN